MLHAKYIKLLCVFVILILVGITSFVMLFPEKNNKQVGATLPSNPDDMPKLQEASRDDTDNLPDNTEKIGTILPGASDEEMNAYLAKLDNTEITLDMIDTSDPSFIKFQKKLELIRAGKHSGTNDPAPRLEDFESKLDYYEARLEFYKEKLSRAEIPKYQDTFKSIIESIEEDIADEKAWIAGAEERHKEELREVEMDAKLVEMNVSIALLMAQSSDEDWSFYIEDIAPSIPIHLQDVVLEKFLRKYKDLETSEDTSLSDTTPPSVELSEVDVVPESNRPVDERALPDQMGSWHKELIKTYPDIFAYPDVKSREAFSQKLPSEGSRQYFRERQTALHKEYAKLLASQLKRVPKEEREQAIATSRQLLLQKWDADFAEAVIRQLQQEK